MKTTRKTQIIQTAAKLFHEKDYNAVSMRDLANHLGIKAASLYNHISSKQEILALVVMEVAQRFTVHMEDVFSQKGDTLEKLEAIVQMHVDITIEKTDFLACMNDEWKHLDPKSKQTYIKMRDDYEEHFRQIIKTGIASGELQQRDPEIVIFTMLSTLRTLYLWYVKNKSFDKHTLKENVKKNLLQGIVNA